MFVKLDPAAKILGFDSSYPLRQLIRKGLCPAVTIGGKYYVDTEEVKQFLLERSLQNLRTTEGPEN